MRQVINKLITEEDLYAAVESAYSPGLAAGEALLPHRPADRDRRGHPRHRRAGPQRASSIGRPTTTSARRSRSASAGSCPSRSRRSSGSGRTPRPSCAARSASCATTLARPRACSSSGTTRRPRSSRASSAGATAASAPVIEDVWRAGGTFQEWGEHFRLDLWSDAMAADGLDLDWYVHRHRTEDEVLPVGPPLGRPPQGLPLAGLARRPRRGRPRGLPLDALLRLRRLHRLRHRARRRLGRPAGRRQPGHRPGPAVGRRRCRSRCSPRRAGRGGRMKLRVRFAKLGKVRFLRTATWPASGSGRCAGPSCRVAYTEGFSPRPKLELRAGPLHRPRVLGEYLDVDLGRATVDLDAARRPGSTRRLPVGHRRAQAAVRIAAGHRLAPGGRHQLRRGEIEVAGVDPRRGRRRGRARRSPPTTLAITRRAQGAARSPTTSAPPSVAAVVGPHRRRAPTLVAELATQPRGLRPARAAPSPRSRRGPRGSVLPDPPMDVGRRRPLRADPLGDLGARGATSTPHAEARAS